jgi:hypothetical protein
VVCARGQAPDALAGIYSKTSLAEGIEGWALLPCFSQNMRVAPTSPGILPAVMQRPSAQTAGQAILQEQQQRASPEPPWKAVLIILIDEAKTGG